MTQIPGNQNEDLCISIASVAIDPSAEKEQTGRNSVQMKRADVEVIVKKTILNKRKDNDGTADEISIGVVEIPVNPRKMNEVSLSTMEDNEALLVISSSNFSRLNLDGSCTKLVSIMFRVREATTESDDSEESDTEESEGENESSSEEELGRQKKRKKLSDSEGEDPAGISLKNLTTGPRKRRGRNNSRKEKNEALKTDCKGEEEPSKGKRKFHAYYSRKPPVLKKNANTTKTVQYETELLTINTDQECLVHDGDYELVLNEVKPKEVKDYKRKAVWESFDGGREIKVYSALTGPSLKLLFKWRCSNEQGPFSMDSLNNEEEEDSDDPDLNKRRTRNFKNNKTSTSATNSEISDNAFKFKVDRVEYLKSRLNSRGRNGVFNSFDNSGVARVYYQFMYNNNTQQQTESREDFYCPWCQLNCMTIYGLMKHLKLCHPRFLFSYSQQPRGTRIIVTVNECYDGSYTGNPQNIFSQPGLAFSRRGPVRRIPVTDILVYRPQRATNGIDPNVSLAELLEKEDTEAMEATQYSAGHRRLYFHSPTTMPVRPCEFDMDSEGEREEPDWLFGHTKRMIDEFTDVNEGEKAIMKIWNLHVMRHNCIADIQIEEESMRFMEENVKLLVDYNLRRNLLLHFICLVDFGVFKTSSVMSLMDHFDKVKKEYKESCNNIEAKSNESKDLMSLDFPKPDLFPRIAQLEEVLKDK